jgi:hypothetical protein
VGQKIAAAFIRAFIMKSLPSRLVILKLKCKQLRVVYQSLLILYKPAMDAIKSAVRIAVTEVDQATIAAHWDQKSIFADAISRFAIQKNQQLEQKNQKIYRCGSTAQSVRELVDLGFQIEETATRKNENNTASNNLSFMIDVMKNNLKWMLEILLITRQMTGFLSQDENENLDEMLKKYKGQAAAHIKKIFKEEG